MINTIEGSILEVETGFIVHGCNMQGKMGSGVAKVLRDRYPTIYRPYAYLCEMRKNAVDEGTRNLYNIAPQEVRDGLFVINALTQEFYGYDGAKYVSYEQIIKCFKEINDLIPEYVAHGLIEDTTVNFPLIGCDLGGGDWTVVSALIDEQIDDKYTKNLWILK